MHLEGSKLNGAMSEEEQEGKMRYGSQTKRRTKDLLCPVIRARSGIMTNRPSIMIRFCQLDTS
ncbi:hypothetical protein I79_008934 [Cricetulus griseus]|uniref:Uncharacterized protein n=1 Tax=Cricetulus griseus TaxID=10029 RepID=G3HEF0_CRIGR|nr:hypothetical protein I79_008934 [Cricetulus griseus]